MSKESFEDWFTDKYSEAMQWRDWQKCEQYSFAKSHMKNAWNHQAKKIEALEKEITKLKAINALYKESRSTIQSHLDVKTYDVIDWKIHKELAETQLKIDKLEKEW